MGEVVQFPDRPIRGGMPDTELFRETVFQQQRDAEIAARARTTCRQPTLAESQAAKKELDFIFGGENAAVANQMYLQGKDDVVHSRRKVVDRMVSFVFTDGFTVYHHEISATGGYTDAATFYAYVEHLTATAAVMYDRPSGYVNEARYGRLDDNSVATGEVDHN